MYLPAYGSWVNSWKEWYDPLVMNVSSFSTFPTLGVLWGSQPTQLRYSLVYQSSIVTTSPWKEHVVLLLRQPWLLSHTRCWECVYKESVDTWKVTQKKALVLFVEWWIAVVWGSRLRLLSLVARSKCPFPVCGGFWRTDTLLGMWVCMLLTVVLTKGWMA